MPSRMTLYRAGKNPAKAMALSLCEYASKNRTTAEELLNMPLHFEGRRIDGKISQDGYLYTYQTDIPEKPNKFALYVFDVGGKLIVSRKNKIADYDEIVGIVTMRIKLMPVDEKREAI